MRRNEPQRGGCFSGSIEAWRILHAHANWTRANPAPVAWAEMDISWQMCCGTLMTERDLSVFLGWPRRLLRRTVSLVKKDRDLWLEAAPEPEPDQKRTKSGPKADQPGTVEPGEQDQNGTKTGPKLDQKRTSTDFRAASGTSSTRGSGAGSGSGPKADQPGTVEPGEQDQNGTKTGPDHDLEAGGPKADQKRTKSGPKADQPGTVEPGEQDQNGTKSGPKADQKRTKSGPLTRADPLRELNTNTLSDSEKREGEKSETAFGVMSAGGEVEAAPSVPEVREVRPNRIQRPIRHWARPNAVPGSRIDCGGFQPVSAEVAAILSERQGSGESVVLKNPPWHLKKKLGILSDEDTAASVAPEPESVPPSPLEGIDLPTFFSSGPGGAEGGSLGGFQKLVTSLVSADIQTAKDLENITFERLRFLPGIGSNHAQAIESRMVAWGSSLAPDPEARFRELVRLASRHPKPPEEVGERDRRWLAAASISWSDLRKSTEFTLGSLCKSFVAGSAKKARAA